MSSVHADEQARRRLVCRVWHGAGEREPGGDGGRGAAQTAGAKGFWKAGEARERGSEGAREAAESIVSIMG